MKRSGPLSGFTFFSVLVAALLAGAVAQARAPEIYMGRSWDYAVNGYDVVAYFSLEQGAKPVPGSDEFTTTYRGVDWRFSSQENLDAFTADPDRYRPQYGGHCAYALAKGQLAKGDPRAWRVYNGKLYLNLSKGVQRRWLKDIEGYLARSEANWPDILDRK